jgi:hypothetical protein
MAPTEVSSFVPFSLVEMSYPQGAGGEGRHDDQASNR